MWNNHIVMNVFYLYDKHCHHSSASAHIVPWEPVPQFLQTTLQDKKESDCVRFCERSGSFFKDSHRNFELEVTSSQLLGTGMLQGSLLQQEIGMSPPQSANPWTPQHLNWTKAMLHFTLLRLQLFYCLEKNCLFLCVLLTLVSHSVMSNINYIQIYLI